MTKPSRAVPLAAALLVLLGACGGTDPAPPAPGGPATTTGPTAPASVASASVAPTTTSPPADDPLTFTVDGIGPYEVGAALDDLLESGLLDEVTTGGTLCPQNTTARGTDEWTDVRLSFRPDGALYLVTSRSPAISTPSGATLGTTMAELNTLYASATHEELGDGFYSAFLVRAGSAGRGILFDLGSDDEVFAMIAGDANYLHDAYANGTDFC